MPEKIKAATGLVIVYGHAAAEVVPEADVLVYVDMARWEIQQRFRQGKIDGLGVKKTGRKRLRSITNADISLTGMSVTP